jgi:hypothetical protein
MLNRYERKQIMQDRITVESLGWVSYSLGTFLPSVATLFLNKTLGPIDNAEYICLLVRNVFCVLWFGVLIIGNQMLLHRFTQVLTQVQSPLALASLEKMQKAVLGLKRLYMVLVVIYIVLSLPYLWAYQTYGYALTIFAGLLKHTGLVFLVTYKPSEEERTIPTTISSNRNIIVTGNSVLTTERTDGF